ncbi:MAG: CcmD family protein [Vicinamibacterales bacterium]
MTILRRVLALLLLLTTMAVSAPLLAQQPAPQMPEQQDEFIPIDQLPPQDQLPAAPLLIGAYAFVLVALFLYVFSVAKRLSTVQREVERLEGDLKRSGRG